MSTKVNLDHVAIREFLNDETGPVGIALMKRAVVVERTAKSLAAVDSGLLRASIRGRLEKDSRGLFGRIGTTVSYAKYVEVGTGLYGPRKKKITPRTAQALKFTVGGKTVFAKSVKGQRPQPFLRPAIAVIK